MYTIGIGIWNKKKKTYTTESKKYIFLVKSIRCTEELCMRCSIVITLFKLLNLKIIIALETRFFVNFGKM